MALIDKYSHMAISNTAMRYVKVELERTAGELAVSGYMARGAGESCPALPAPWDKLKASEKRKA
ncbi:hypothetical protein ES703_119506 [subsurface metagenome]